MLNATRRRFFGLLGATPLAAKVAADEAVANLARISTSGLVPASSLPGSEPIKTADYKRAFANPLTRQAVVDLLYEEQRFVSFLDPDLAALRSFSLNAKVTFQRQRNVERRLEEMQSGWVWHRLDSYVKDALGLWK